MYLFLFSSLTGCCCSHIPFSGRNPKLNVMLRGRPKILVLNKEDLCNQEAKEVGKVWRMLIHWNPRVMNCSVICTFMYLLGIGKEGYWQRGMWVG